MDSHIPEGMRPMLHPHKRSRSDGIEPAETIELDRVRALGRDVPLRERIANHPGVMRLALRRLLRAET